MKKIFIILAVLSCQAFASEKEALNLHDLPEDVIVNILTRVPKQALRSEVCKKWQETKQIRFKIFEIHPKYILSVSDEERISCLEEGKWPHFSLKFTFQPTSWEFLNQFSNLRTLEIKNGITISPSVLVKLPKLEDITLMGENFTSPFENLEEGYIIPNLKTLYITDNDLSCSNARHWVRSLTTLESLYIMRNNLGVEGGKSLASLTSLTKLHTSSNGLMNDGVQSLSVLTKLKQLDITSNDCGGYSLLSLTSLRNLEVLHVQYNFQVNNAVKSLETSIPGLKVYQ